MTEVKICGLSAPEALEAALAAGADYVGLVFYSPSPRHVGLGVAQELADRARGRAKVVALTVDAGDEELAEIANLVRPDLIQAHGAETPSRVREMAQSTGIPVVKAIKVRTAADIEGASRYAGAAEMLLFDAKAPEDLAAALPGGNGLTFDWGLLGGEVRPRFMLSGGLNPRNVARAIGITRAPVVDVSSGVESAPGVKDPALIRKFIEAAKSVG
jgi:phosphoribosylanthranilate isomerase